MRDSMKAVSKLKFSLGIESYSSVFTSLKNK